MEQPGSAEDCCPTCATRYTRGALLCPVCGTSLAVTIDADPPDAAPNGFFAAPPASEDTVYEAAAPASQPEAAPAHLANGDDGKRCSWCGAVNVPDAESCLACGAAFPRPEQDEALLRASRERIRAANESIATLRQERERKGLGRLFGR